MIRVKDKVLEDIKNGILLKLNVGAGHKVFDEYYSVDILEEFDPDILCDLEKDGIPIPDNTVNAVLLDYILEHVEKPLDVMQEVWRICVHGADIYVGVPYFGWKGQAQDPTHKRSFDVESYRYWDAREVGKPNYGHTSKFDLIKLELNTHPDYGKIPDAEKKFALEHFINMVTKINYYLKAVKD